MKEISYTIKNRLGIPSRFAIQFVREMEQFSSAMSVLRDADKCDGKKLYGLMSLQIKKGETILVRAVGSDEDAAVNAAYDFLNKKGV
jgi:phosphotransferase system HPr (HPr) family protein